MSVFEQTISIRGPEPSGWEDIAALVDTGSIYTVMPEPLLNRLGVTPSGRRRFRIADNSVIEREIGDAVVRIDGEMRTTVVVFGGAQGSVLLGAVT